MMSFIIELPSGNVDDSKMRETAPVAVSKCVSEALPARTLLNADQFLVFVEYFLKLNADAPIAGENVVSGLAVAVYASAQVCLMPFVIRLEIKRAIVCQILFHDCRIPIDK